MSELRECIIVGQEAGCVGKTTTVAFLAEFYRESGRLFTVLDADDKNLTTAGGSALAHALPHHTVTWLGTGPSMAEMEANADKGNAHWDKVRAVLDHHDVLLDLGANTVQRLLEYATRMRVARRWAEDGIQIEFWVPVNSDKINIESGVKALRSAGKALGAAGLRAVRNARDGEFGSWMGTPQGLALTALQTAGVAVVDLPKAPIPPDGLKAMKRGPWSPFQIRDMGRIETAAKLGLPAPVAERTVYGCEDWIESVTEAWSGLIPPGKE